MSKITEYAAAQRFDSGDVLLKDGANGTKTISAVDAAIEFAGLVGAIQHRNVYGGRNLGTSITEEQKAAIKSGTFDNLFPGDYWTINGHRYDIADMDYWYNCGDTAFTTHHLVMVPHRNLYNHPMNDTNTTEGGYIGSKMYTEGLNQAKTQIAADFGDMLLTHREILINAVTDGHPSGYEWIDSSVELMTEIMVYGCKIYSPMGSGVVNPIQYTIDKTQLALFALSPKDINIRQNYWLRDVVSAALFANVSTGGSATFYHASGTNAGVRPVFPIGVK